MAKKKKDETPVADQERADQTLAEADNQAQASDTGGQLVDEEQLDAAQEQKITDTEQVVPAELAAIHTDTVSARDASGDAESKPKQSQPAKTAKKRQHQRSARYQTALEKIQGKRAYPLAEAIALAKQTSYATFDAAIELHVRIERKKEGDALRGLVQLPHGGGKQVNAVILTEELIDEIATSKRVSADVLIAPTKLMPKVAKIAKVLGPIGKMPSPKAGTVSDTPEEILTAISSGRVEYRADAGGNVHLAIGRVSWGDEKLQGNAEAVLSALPKQLLSVTVSATMGPGVPVELSTL